MGGFMILSEPSNPQHATWQLPWLRMSLILRTMAENADCRDEELLELLRLRQDLAQSGWFN
jgi:hypothetical protein